MHDHHEDEHFVKESIELHGSFQCGMVEIPSDSLRGYQISTEVLCVQSKTICGY